MVQLNALAVPENARTPERVPLHAVKSWTLFMNGLGRTVIVVVKGVPEQTVLL